jgi:hypothetical protein
MVPMRGADTGVEVTPTRGGVLARLRGVLDDSFEYAALRELSGVVVIDLDGIRRVSSVGVREWISALRDVPATYLAFVRCRPSIVAQFNMVQNFGGRGEIVSLYAPFVCDACGEEMDDLVDLRRDLGKLTSFDERSLPCTACGEAAQFDDLPASYFSYVLASPPPSPPPLAEAIIDGRSAAKLRVTKEVSEALTTLWLTGTLDRSAHLKRAADGLEGEVLVVLNSVASSTEEGLVRLTALTSAEDADVTLARIPLATARAFLARPDTLGRAHVASIMLPLRCRSCGLDVDRELDAAQLAHFAANGQACSRCEQPLEAPQDVTPLQQLPFRALSAAASELLARHPVTPGSGETLVPATTDDTETTGAPRPVAGGRYELLRAVARGGMGTVWLGRAMAGGGFERRVAIKVMHPHLAEDMQFVTMFLDEARLAALIHHPNVVATLDVATGAQGPFLVMDWIEGLSGIELLRALKRDQATLPAPVALRITLDALAGLHCAHELRDPRGQLLDLVHRDVSPHNVLIGTDGIARLTDFGVARVAVRMAPETRPGDMKGKIHYMAPELLRWAPADRRSDVYSAGVVAWELFTGTRLYAGIEDAKVAPMVLEKGPEAPHTVNPTIPRAISESIHRAIQFDPSARFPTAEAFALALEEAAQAEGCAPATPRAIGELVQKLRATR